MKPWRETILLATLLLAAATTALAQQTELDKFQKRIQKYATPLSDIFDKPKGLCVCIDDPGNPANNGSAGALSSSIVSVADSVPRRVRVRCLVMQATASGDIVQAQFCDNFVPLAK